MSRAHDGARERYASESMKLNKTYVFLVALALVFGVSAAASAGSPSHRDRDKNPAGCAGCHAGRGISGTPLLRSGFQNLCFTCHGSQDRGRGRKKSVFDLEAVFEKQSVHPVKETTQHHRYREVLPERDQNAPRHVSCYDCHQAHLSEEDRPTKGARGYAPGLIRDMGRGSGPRGRWLREADEGYQICYLCHADSANLPEDARNIAAEFDPQNASFHPVERTGKGNFVPSLIPQFSTNSIVTCGDCHGNSDMVGPRGPHGSDYEPLLIAKYVTEDGPEGSTSYELCYLCHERQSILGDQSFKTHNLHISFHGVACYTCHSSHGSPDKPSLIQFNPAVVNSGSSGGPLYWGGTPGTPTCYLSCHGADHNVSGVAGKAWAR
jgi:predicted CXXCH cytochrome family protein